MFRSFIVLVTTIAFLILCIRLSSNDTYLLHSELLNFMLIAMSTQLLSGPSPGLADVNPFIDAAMAQVIDEALFYC